MTTCPCVCTRVRVLSGMVKCADCSEAGWQYFNGQMSELTKNVIHNWVKLYSLIIRFQESLIQVNFD